jgi:acyl-coenzyme A synthetase/AMP-(fatty) acid ligase
VVGLPNEEWGEVPVAAVVLASGAQTSAAELKDWVRANLRSSRVPDDVVFVDHLPHNETGKLLRRVLKQELAIATGLDEPAH